MIPENTVFPYFTLIYSFFYIRLWLNDVSKSIQNNQKAYVNTKHSTYLKAKHDEDKDYHGITKESGISPSCTKDGSFK